MQLRNHDHLVTNRAARSLVWMHERVLLITTVAALSSCAALNTSSMTPACRESYDQCLDACPREPLRDTQAEGLEQSRHGIEPRYVEAASCTDGCNRSGRVCH